MYVAVLDCSVREAVAWYYASSVNRPTQSYRLKHGSSPGVRALVDVRREEAVHLAGVLHLGPRHPPRQAPASVGMLLVVA